MMKDRELMVDDSWLINDRCIRAEVMIDDSRYTLDGSSSRDSVIQYLRAEGLATDLAVQGLSTSSGVLSVLPPVTLPSYSLSQC